MEHPRHVLDTAGVPVTDVLIERLGAVEHVRHVGDATGIPQHDGLGPQNWITVVVDADDDLDLDLTGVDRLIELDRAVEHVRHVGDAAGIPIERTGHSTVDTAIIERLCAVEHVRHVLDDARIPVTDVLIERLGALEHA